MASPNLNDDMVSCRLYSCGDTFTIKEVRELPPIQFDKRRVRREER